MHWQKRKMIFQTLQAVEEAQSAGFVHTAEALQTMLPILLEEPGSRLNAAHADRDGRYEPVGNQDIRIP